MKLDPSSMIARPIPSMHHGYQATVGLWFMKLAGRNPACRRPW